jgi:cell division septation protein DedD
MNKNMLYIALMVLPPCLGAAPCSGAISFSQGDPRALVAEASRQNKLIFAYFGAEWSQPCRWLERNTFADRPLGDMLERHFLAVKVDVDGAEGARLKEAFRIARLPSLLVIDRRGLVIARYEESPPPRRLRELLERHLRDQGLLLEDSEPGLSAPAIPAELREGPVSRPVLSPEAPSPPERSANEYARLSRAQTLSTPPPPNHRPASAASATSAAPRPAAAPAVSPPPAAAAAFGVQTGVFSQNENARRHKEELEKTLDQPVRIISAQIEGKTLYRIVVGAFETRAAAEHYLATLKARSISGLIKDLRDL